MDNEHPSRTATLSQRISEDLELVNMRDVAGDDSQQPLIPDETDDPTALPETTKQEAHRLIWLLTLSAGLSGLLFGYE